MILTAKIMFSKNATEGIDVAEENKKYIEELAEKQHSKINL